jgi:hypothetical protein
MFTGDNRTGVVAGPAVGVGVGVIVGYPGRQATWPRETLYV